MNLIEYARICRCRIEEMGVSRITSDYISKNSLLYIYKDQMSDIRWDYGIESKLLGFNLLINYVDCIGDPILFIEYEGIDLEINDFLNQVARTKLNECRII